MHDKKSVPITYYHHQSAKITALVHIVISSSWYILFIYFIFSSLAPV